jgi:hypothetical protein
VQYFSHHFAARDFAPSGIKASSVDNISDSTGQELLSAWELYHSVGDGSFEKDHDDSKKWWKIIIELKSLRQDEMRSPARPSLNRKGGLQVVRASLQGFTVTITLYSSILDCLRPKDALALENNLKKFFNDTSYQLIVQIITHCELPKFDHGGKAFKEIYQINAKVNYYNLFFLKKPSIVLISLPYFYDLPINCTRSSSQVPLQRFAREETALLVNHVLSNAYREIH